MQIGVIYPQTELPRDPEVIRQYVEAVEEMGYRHISAYDHVIGANPASRPGWRGTYDVDDAFMEPFALFSFMAAVAKKLSFATSILILPQRQTVLAAKQAATLDVLTKGKLRLGVGVGWNDVEYQVLNEEFENRGHRLEEQVELMRQLWSNRSVNFKGNWHEVNDSGINPLPVQRPIPVWMGGGADTVVKRIARMADGWMPQFSPDSRGRAMFEQMRGHAEEFGRDPKEIGLDGTVAARGDDVDGWAETVTRWREIGATHVSVTTMGGDVSRSRDLDSHLERLRRLQDSLAAQSSAVAATG